MDLLGRGYVLINMGFKGLKNVLYFLLILREVMFYQRSPTTVFHALKYFMSSSPFFFS